MIEAEGVSSRRKLVVAVVAVACVALLGTQFFGRTELAGWVHDPNGPPMNGDTTGLTIYVSRLGWPRPFEPAAVQIDIDSDDKSVVLTASVPYADGPACAQARSPMAIEVDLGFQLGNRELLDGRFDPPQRPDTTGPLTLGLPIRQIDGFSR